MPNIESRKVVVDSDSLENASVTLPGAADPDLRSQDSVEPDEDFDSLDEMDLFPDEKILREFQEPDPTAEELERAFELERAKIDTAIAAIAPDLRALGAKVLKHARQNPFSSVVIEDTSGRFVGRYIEKLLKAHGNNVSVFCVKPPETLPGQFKRLSDDKRSGVEQDYQEFRERMEANRELIGAKPLVVTETVDRGVRTETMLRALTGLGAEPAYAVLYYDPRKSLEAGERLRSVTPEGSEIPIFRGRANTYPRSLSEYGMPNLLEHIKGNGALNGIVSSRRFSEFGFDPQRSSDVATFASRISIMQRGERETANRAVQYSREKLKELVAEFSPPSLISRVVRSVSEVYRRAKGYVDEKIWAPPGMPG